MHSRVHCWVLARAKAFWIRLCLILIREPSFQVRRLRTVLWSEFTILPAGWDIFSISIGPLVT